jgi:hypothetical protein
VRPPTLKGGQVQWPDAEPIDAFRQTRMQEVGERFRHIRDEHERMERAQWAGALLLAFDAFELDLLSDMGMLSIRDHDVIRKVARDLAPASSDNEAP